MELSRLSIGAEYSWVGVDGDSGDIDGGAGMGGIIWSVDILCFGGTIWRFNVGEIS
jgi:hypothetical protein